MPMPALPDGVNIARWWTSRPPLLRAAAHMLLSSMCVALQLSAIRILSADLHTFEIVLFRNLVGILVIPPFLGRLGWYSLRTQRAGWIGLSSIALLASMLCFFAAVAAMPLAEVTALAFTKPLFATAGAALILAEVVRLRRWTAVLVGFLGVLIVVQPGAEAVSPYAGLVLLSAVFAAAVALIVKDLTATESPTTIVLYQSLFTTVLSVPLALLYWQIPSLFELLLLFVVGALGTVSWLCMTRAFVLADASIVVPFEFARLPLIAVVAYFLFAEVPTIWTWPGGALIFGATAYITHREVRAASAKRAAQVSS
jgi:drug/metabolite transporter (DMT)-like permease